MAESHIDSIVSSTQAYYDGPADEIYRTVWGDNLHLGVPCGEDCPHPEAAEHTNEIMSATVSLAPGTQVLDLGWVMGRPPATSRRNSDAASPARTSA